MKLLPGVVNEIKSPQVSQPQRPLPVPGAPSPNHHVVLIPPSHVPLPRIGHLWPACSDLVALAVRLRVQGVRLFKYEHEACTTAFLVDPAGLIATGSPERFKTACKLAIVRLSSLLSQHDRVKSDLEQLVSLPTSMPPPVYATQGCQCCHYILMVSCQCLVHGIGYSQAIAITNMNETLRPPLTNGAIILRGEVAPQASFTLERSLSNTFS